MRRVRGFLLGAVVVGLMALLSVRICFEDSTVLDWFFLGSIALGGIVAAFLRRSRATTPDIGDEGRRPEISIHHIPVGGGVAGLIFAVGSCLVFLVGIPALRWFLLLAVVVGSAVGGFLWRWHKNRPVEITDIHDANG
ncbi:MAG: hypothetical protein ACM3JB_14815 [Acidobacteriaceae bacterium]